MGILLETGIHLNALPDGYDLTGKLIKHTSWGYGTVTRDYMRPTFVSGEGTVPRRCIDVHWDDNVQGIGFELDGMSGTVLDVV